MSAAQRELLQLAILRVLDANHTRWGLNLNAITLHASAYGFPKLTSDQVEVELEYLEGKALVELAAKVLEPANRAWKRTAAGRDYLSERGY